jgi:anti-sigma B factor antagonist
MIIALPNQWLSAFYRKKGTMEGIQISVYYVGVQEDIALVQIGGYLDTVTSPHLENALEDVTTEGYYHIICDLRNVNYISSAGWGIFVSKIKMVRDMGGDLVLSQMIPDVYDVFKLLEFDRILKFYDSTDKAVKEFDEMRGLQAITHEASDTITDSRLTGSSQGSDNPSSLLDHGVSHDKDYSSSLLSPTEGEERTDSERDLKETAEVRGAVTPVDKSFPIFPYNMDEQDILDRDLPLNEKIKLTVIDNPLAGVNTIRRVLNSNRFGYVKVGFIKVKKILKELDLDSKEKRYRFWRSR